jgi:hypothetical protein
MLLNRRSDKDQRSSDDRRKDSADDLDSEQRLESDPRRTTERRVLRYAVLFKTGVPIPDLEAWLNANCEGDCSMVLEDMDTDLTSKTLRIMFETEEDRERFKASADSLHR